jgi:hypothetical protein
VYVEHRDKLHQALIRNKIYAAVIWPLPEKAAEICATAQYVNRHMLAIPCDHRCSRADMDFIAQIIKENL